MFYRQLEQLVYRLLSAPQSPVRITDGLNFPIEERQLNRFFGAGTVIYLAPQAVEPLRVELRFTTDVGELMSGRICVGFRDQLPAPWESPEHYRLERPLLANPKGRFNWREEFDLAGGRWRKRAPDGQFRWPIAQSPPK